MREAEPYPLGCQIANLDERRLQRLEKVIDLTRTKLDVLGIRLDWLGHKLLSTELERAELRRTLAERIWELNILRHRLKRGQQGSQAETFCSTAARASFRSE